MNSINSASFTTTEAITTARTSQPTTSTSSVTTTTPLKITNTGEVDHKIKIHTNNYDLP